MLGNYLVASFIVCTTKEGIQLNHQTALVLPTHKLFYGTKPLSVMSPENLKKCEIEIQPNQAYEAVTRPRPSRLATQVPAEPSPDYEALDH